jgi:hypothetical protein
MTGINMAEGREKRKGGSEEKVLQASEALTLYAVFTNVQ